MRFHSPKDHRGQFINLFGLPGMRARHETQLSIPKDVHLRIKRRMGYRLYVVLVAAFVASFALCLVGYFVVTVILSELFSVRVPRSTLLAINLVLFLVTAIVTASFQQATVLRVFTPRIMAAFLAERRCPACAYDLAGGVVAEDGCTVCPECSAAWKLRKAA